MSDASAPVLRLRAPMLLLVLAFTAVPAELRSVDEVRARTRIDVRANPRDVVANIGGYVPVGAVLANLGPLRAVGAGAAMSLAVETSQVFSRGRFPSPVDLAANVLGTVVGWFLVRRTGLDVSRVPLTPAVAWLAIGGAAFYIALGTVMARRQMAADAALNGAVVPSSLRTIPTNPNGADRPGGLEGHWPLDVVSGGTTPDASGHGRDGLVRGASLDDGIRDRAVTFDGPGRQVDLGSTTGLRLTGSMTISAWIHPRRFPPDDAPIVSNHNGPGYQLDVTADRGFRTIGFKLAAPAGRIIARYGRTLIDPGEWYHAAGVYDARSGELSVYLNGALDNGCLIGPVPERQQVSNLPTYIGRRPDRRNHVFIGSIDDVRIYSMALTPSEIQQVMAGEQISIPGGFPSDRDPDPPSRASGESGVCLPTLLAANTVTRVGSTAFGLLVAVAWLGLIRRSAARWQAVVVAAVAGLLLLPTSASALPPGDRWLVPVLCAFGASCIALSLEPASTRRSVVRP